MTTTTDLLAELLAALSAADRKALLAKVSAAAVHPETERRIKRALNGLAPSENHDRIVDAMCAEGVVRNYLPGEFHASADDLKKQRIDRLAAAAQNPKTKSSFGVLEGILRRGGVKLEEIAGADVVQIDRVFASSKMSTSDRMAVKAMLHRFGAI